MSGQSLRLATRADDAALRRLLRENPMRGVVSLSYEREPDFFIAAGMEGTLSQTVVRIDDESGAILGMGTRVVRDMYMNGEARQVGYMGHLRADLRHSWGLSLARQLASSFEKFRELHEDGRVPFYLMSVVSDNGPARRLLTAGLPGMPQAHEYARFVTHVIAPRRTRPPILPPVGMRRIRGSAAWRQPILDCLNAHGPRRQFAPAWTADELFSASRTPNLKPEDFILVVEGERVAGCLALWDQSTFKQTVVRGYAEAMGAWRRAINALGRIIEVPRLPEVGTALSALFASHLTLENDDPRVFATLLRDAYNETVRRGSDYFMVGLSEDNPLRKVLTRGYLPLTYRSQIYLMAWEDGLDAIREVDGRMPGLEIAVM